MWIMVSYSSNKAEAIRFSPCGLDSTGLDMIFSCGWTRSARIIYLHESASVLLEVNCY